MTSLVLESACTLRESADLHFALLAVSAGAEPCYIDGSAVERVDTAGLQMLAALFCQRAAAGRSTGWTAASPELVRCATRLGLEQVLHLPASDSGDVPCR